MTNKARPNRELGVVKPKMQRRLWPRSPRRLSATTPLRIATASLLAFAGLPLLSSLRGRSFVAVLLGICPPIVCAWIALTSGDCSLFERSGSI